MAVMDIIDVATINGYTKSLKPSNTTQNTMSLAPATNKTAKINSIVVANITSGAATATVELYDGTSYFPVAYQISVPGNASLIVADKTTGIYLVDTDTDGSGVPSEVYVTSGTSNALVFTATYELLATT